VGRRVVDTLTCVDEDLSGTRLGPYLLGARIGRGGTSTVYRAVDNRTGRVRACKVLSRRAAAEPAMRARAAVVATVRHPHVLAVDDVGEDRGRLYLAMQLVAGPTVREVLAEGPVTAARAALIVEQVAAALAALHDHGLLHLDVTPANVLLAAVSRSAGEEPSDHSYLLDGAMQGSGSDSDGNFVGTPNYASPEHLRGGRVGPRSDVYSLTCLLFTLLTGRAPFTGRLVDVITGQLQERPPQLPAALGLPVALKNVVAAGLCADPVARPANPTALAAAVKDSLQTAPLLALAPPEC
jgi:serine/threonine protein kinase